MPFLILAILAWLAAILTPRARRRPSGPRFETLIDMGEI